MKLKEENPILVEGRTMFPKRVKSSSDRNILGGAENNTKLGNGKRIIRKGKWKGMPLFTLTLEERKTCPRSCEHWRDCFGNNMYLATRISHKDSFFEDLEREISNYAQRYPNGFVVRLHVLGDFFSVEYVELWGRLLKAFPQLKTFGYSAVKDGEISKALHTLRKKYRKRFQIRQSSNNSFSKRRKFLKFAANEKFKGKGIVCPHSTGQVESCVTCGLCFEPNFDKTIIFPDH